MNAKLFSIVFLLDGNLSIYSIERIYQHSNCNLLRGCINAGIALASTSETLALAGENNKGYNWKYFMKKLIQTLTVLFLMSSCGRLLKDNKSQTVIVNDAEPKVQLNSGVFLYDESNDTIRTDTFRLKNNYKLIVFPSKNKDNDKYIYFNFLGKGVDTIIMSDVISTKKNSVYFDNSDFDNFFAIKQNGGSSIFFFLFDKEKHRQCLNGLQVEFDLINELIIFKDDKYNLYLFDCKSEKKIPINIPFNKLKKYDCIKYGNIENEINIKRVSRNYYYFGFDICDSIVSFRVKK